MEERTLQVGRERLAGMAVDLKEVQYCKQILQKVMNGRVELPVREYNYLNKVLHFLEKKEVEGKWLFDAEVEDIYNSWSKNVKAELLQNMEGEGK